MLLKESPKEIVAQRMKREMFEPCQPCHITWPVAAEVAVSVGFRKLKKQSNADPPNPTSNEIYWCLKSN